MKKVLDRIDKFENYLLISLLIVMTVIIIAQVICRFIFKFSLAWSEELARYLLVWATFVGASVGVRNGSHIGVEAFTLLLPKKFRKYVGAFAFILCALFCILVFKESLSILQKQILNKQISPAMQIPMWLSYLAIPAGMLLMTIRFIQAVFTTLAQKVVTTD